MVERKGSLKHVSVFLLTVCFVFFPFMDHINSTTNATEISLQTNPICVAINPDTNQAVVVNEKSDSVSVVDLDTQMVLTIPTGRAPSGVAIDSELNLALVSNTKDDTVSIIDLHTSSIIKTIPVGKEPEGLSINSTTHTALVANHKDDAVSIIDLITLTTVGTVKAGKAPIDVAVDSGLNLALIVNEKDCTVSVIDLKSYQVTKTISVGKKPQAIDVNPESHLAAVANEKDNSITTIDLQTWRTTDIPVCKHPIDVAINPLDNKALIICDEDRSLVLVDLETKAILEEYFLDKLPKGVAVNHFTNVTAVTDDNTDSLTLIQLPNPLPEITSMTPAIAQRGSGELQISIEGNKFIRTTKVFFENHLLDSTFVDNHRLNVMIPPKLLLKAGTFKISAANPAPEGGTSESVNFAINNPVPTITAIEPAEAISGTQGLTLNIHGGGFFDDTEIYFGEVKKSAIYINNSKLQMELTSEDLRTHGKYEIIAHNLAPGGGNSNRVIFTVKTPLEVKITSPRDGEEINRAKAIVKGTFKSDIRDIGITVNGITTEIRENEWVANSIPLTVGLNNITATIKDSSGNSADASITVSASSAAQSVTLSANITSGIAPLTTYFSVSTEIPNPIVHYQIDFEGDGLIDYTGTTLENVGHTYSSEGFFYPTVTITDNQGNSYWDAISIAVLSKTETDAFLKSKWEGMKGALANKDIEKAMSHFLSVSQERYRNIFTSLLSVLPDIAVSMQAIEMISLEGGVAEYRIKRTENVGEVTYYIYFVLDENGLWKIQQF
jgi:YVTN family beta-propeller protein